MRVAGRSNLTMMSEETATLSDHSLGKSTTPNSTHEILNEQYFILIPKIIHLYIVTLKRLALKFSALSKFFTKSAWMCNSLKAERRWSIRSDWGPLAAIPLPAAASR